MPACRDCRWFLNTGRPKCAIYGCVRGSVMRSCVLAILLKNIKDIEGDVLEVGIGVWRTSRRMVKRKKNTLWHGIDIRWETDIGSNYYRASVENIPFDNNKFDWILGSETIEHWDESIVEKGLSEIHRVLKPKGKLLLTVPIYSHGKDVFLYGDMDKIRALFADNMWANVIFEEWRKNYKPLKSNRTWKRKKRNNQRLRKTNPSSWTLEILAEKK